MMGDESWREGTVAQRNLHLLNSEFMADCTFVVGITEKKHLRCHKYILSHGSSVFCAMFNGELQEKGEVKVDDIEPQHFRKMLEFIYSDNTELDNAESALSVCYAANKYMIKTLTLKCIDFIRENLDADSVCSTLEFARLIDNADLEAECLQYLQFHTSNVLKSDSFLNAEKSTLLTILSQDDLLIASEVELFSACIRWAEAQVRDAKMTLREILGPEVLKLIRFLAMSAKEFATFVIPSEVLPVREGRDIICCLATESNEHIPLGFNTNTQIRVAFNGPKETIELHHYNISHQTGQVLNNHPFNFSVNVDSLIFGLQFHGLYDSRPAEDSFEVDFLQASKLLASAKFEGLVSRRQIIEVSFKMPCLLKANTNYTLQVKYSNLNTRYVTIQRNTIEYNSQTGLKMSVDFTYTTIFKITIAKKSQ